MFESICVVGNGRVGRAASARLAERGIAVRSTGRELDVASPDLVLLCVPDRAIAEVARALAYRTLGQRLTHDLARDVRHGFSLRERALL